MKIKLPSLTKLGSRNVGKTTLVINVLAILVVVNFIASFFPIRLDLTENKAFSLSQVTRETIKNLDDLVTIKVFLSENLPGQFAPIKQRIKDTLTELKSVSPNKLKIIYIDPKNNQDLVNQALNLGIPQLRLPDVQNDKFSFTLSFIGMAVTAADKKAVIPTVSNETNLEHNLAAAIRKVSGKAAAVVGLTSGHGETDLKILNKLGTDLENDFELSQAEVGEGDQQEMVPENIRTLLMINPTEKFGERSLFVLDQFLMRGGSLVIFNNGIEVSGNLQPSTNPTNINRLLENYGLKINSDLILSTDNVNASFSTGFSNLVVPYPFWVRILKPGFDQNYPATNNIDTAVFPWVSSLSIEKDRIGDQASITELVRTSKHSFVQKTINLEPTQEFHPRDDELKEFTLAALATGKFKSLFKGSRELPKLIRKGETFIEESRDKSQLAVFSDGDFVIDYFVRNFDGNASLALNVIESVSGDSKLSQIRTKGSTFKPLRELPEVARNLTKWINVVIIPLLLGVFGTLRIFLRSR